MLAVHDTVGSNLRSFSRSSSARLHWTLMVVHKIVHMLDAVQIAGRITQLLAHQVSWQLLVPSPRHCEAPEHCQDDLPATRRTHGAKRQPGITASGDPHPRTPSAADQPEAGL